MTTVSRGLLSGLASVVLIMVGLFVASALAPGGTVVVVMGAAALVAGLVVGLGFAPSRPTCLVVSVVSPVAVVVLGALARTQRDGPAAIGYSVLNLLVMVLAHGVASVGAAQLRRRSSEVARV